MSVLIITRSDDNECIRMVADQLIARGETCIRFDTDHYPLNIGVSTPSPKKDGHGFIRIGEDRIEMSEISGVWYRRYFAGGRLPDTLGDTRPACVNEARRTLYGTIAALPCFQLDPLICVRKADHKELQLDKASQFGMEIPDTLFTNDPDDANAFIENHGGKVITKMQSSFAVYRDGDELVVFTSKVKPETMDELLRLRYSPMIFQEWLPKKLDIRSTVVGKQIFSSAIDSQTQEKTEIDWRRDGAGTLEEWVPYQLPPEIETALLNLTEEFGLNYAAADFVVTKDDRLVFLEINAGGEWFWLARTPGLPIAEAIADTLTGKVDRVQSWPWERTRD
ncbi:MAG: MvdC/MvdD family ATP grasp protein [Planctomycetota bacterium]